MATRLAARTLLPQAYSRTAIASSASSPARVRPASPHQQTATVRSLPTVSRTVPATMQTYLINMTELDRRICRKREEECEMRRRRGTNDEEYAGLGIATGARRNSHPDDVRLIPMSRPVVFEECPLLL